MLTDERDIKDVLKTFHDSHLGNHQGIKRTQERIGQQYLWKGLATDIERHIKQICTLSTQQTVYT